MSAPLIELETQDFVSASRRLELWAADPMERATTRLCRVLGRSSAMAGSDPGATAWAGAYDPAARAALSAAQGAIASVHRLAAMFAQTARNYAAADAASTAGVRRLVDDAVAALLPIGSYVVPACVPSAAGGSGGTPAGWGLIAHLVGEVWPNGHQDRLRAAAQAWREAGLAVEDAAGQVVEACGSAVSDRLPERDDMWRVCDALSRQLRELADIEAELAGSCEQLARHIDDAHAAALGELTGLLEWTAAIEAGSAVLSVVTLGASEAAGQGVEAARIAATAARVAAIIERFTALARDLARTVAVLAERADRVAAAMTGLLDARLSAVVVRQVRTMPSMLRVQELLAVRRLGALAGEFPALTVTAKQVERKFLHARAFGVRSARGRKGFDAFGEALRTFVQQPATRRVLATYRREPVIVSYQLKSRLAVIQRLDGSFLSGWRLTRDQIIHLVRNRSVGGG